MKPNAISVLFRAWFLLITLLALSACGSSGGNDDDDTVDPNDDDTAVLPDDDDDDDDTDRPDGPIPPDEIIFHDQLPCEPGEFLTCMCDDPAYESEKTCLEDGNAWSECDCAIQEPVYAEGVTPIDLTEQPDLTFDGPSAELPLEGNQTLLDLQPGDPIVINGGTGLMGYVETVEVIEDRIVIVVDQEGVTLPDFYDRLDLSFEAEFPPINLAERGLIQQAGGDNEVSFFGGVSVKDIDFFIYPWGGFDYRLGTCVDDCASVCVNSVKHWYNPFDYIWSCIQWAWRCATSFLCVKYVGMYTSVNFNVGADVNAFVQASGTRSQSKDIVVPPVLVAAGSGWRLLMEYPVGASISLQGQLKLQSEFGLNGTAYAGASYYRDYGWSKWGDIYFNRNFSVRSQTEVTSEFKIAFSPTLYYEIAGTFGPYVDWGPHFKITSELFKLNELTNTSETKFPPVVDAFVGGSANIGGKIELLGLFNLYNISWPLYEKDFKVWTSDPQCDYDWNEYVCIDSKRYRRCEKNFTRHQDFVDHWSDPIACLGSCASSIGDPIERNPCAQCRNGQKEYGEVCDIDSACAVRGPGRLEGYDECYWGKATCSNDCSNVLDCRLGSVGCGNGVLEGCEYCDGLLSPCNDGCYEGTAPCADDCYDFADTCDVGAQVCGNDIVEGCETCDQTTVRRCRSADGCYFGQTSCLGDCSGFSSCDIGVQVCGNDIIEGCEICDGGSALCNDGCYNGSTVCNADCSGYDGCDVAEQRCGNGTLEGCEACDGQTENCSKDGKPGTRTCLADCSGYGECITGAETCGNGIIEAGETCDGETDVVCTVAATNYAGTQSCQSDCAGYTACVATESCGDGTVNGNETCEDTSPANAATDAGCTAGAPNCAGCLTCSADVCGDGIVGPSEVCDDGPNNGSGAGNCWTDCQRVQACGNGFLEGAEVCDDGNTNPCDGCNADCTRLDNVCGDLIVECAEDCDEGGSDTFTCDGDCTAPTCGDGYVNTAIDEECDSGGVQTATCETSCQFSTCGDYILNTLRGEECDEGYSPTCDSDCTFTSCGDGTTNSAAGEECDDGNTVDCDFCAPDCTDITGCGDGRICGGEDCDDGNTVNGDGCGRFCYNECALIGNVDLGDALGGGFFTGVMEYLTVGGNDYVVVGVFSQGLKVVDVTTPSNPTIVATYNRDFSGFWDPIQTLDVSGDRVYIGYTRPSDTVPTLDVVSLANPAAPVSLGTFNAGNLYPWGLHVYSNYVAAITEFGGATHLKTYDVSVPATITEVDSLQVSCGDCVGPLNLASSGGELYGIASPTGGSAFYLSAHTISAAGAISESPYNQQPLSTFGLSTQAASTFPRIDLEGAFHTGGLTYRGVLANSNLSALAIFSQSPAGYAFQGSTTLPTFNKIRGVHVHGGYAFAVTDDQGADAGTMYVVNVSDPTAPFLTVEMALGGGQPSDVLVDPTGTWAFTSEDGPRGLSVFDISGCTP